MKKKKEKPIGVEPISGSKKNNVKLGLWKKVSKVFGISGKIGSGKTTLADYLETKNDFKQFTFAKNIKKVTAIITDTSMEKNLVERSFKPKFDGFEGKTLSQLHVEIGEIIRFKYSSSVWINSIWSKINKYVQKERCIVVSDVRTELEAEWLKKEYNAIIIRLERPKKFREKFFRGRNPDSNIECALDNYDRFDHVIQNDKEDLEDLYKNFEKLNVS